MTRTILTTLLLLAFVAWLIVFPPVDGSGAEVCLGCRQLRGVELRVGFRTEEWQPAGATERWIEERVPEHEHRFVRVGSWKRSGGFSTLVTPPELSVPNDVWLAYLQSLPASAVPDAVAAFNRDTPDSADVFASLDAWLGER